MISIDQSGAVNGAWKAATFATLAAEAAGCSHCPAMCDRSAVLSELNGPVKAHIMFIGEAPGRKGADQTRVPFSGDQSGKNFDRFLASINLRRQDLFITSAALCNPRTASGANRKPSKTELKNCSEFLRRTFELIDPAIVITLGSVALEAISAIQPHGLILKESAARIHQWNGRVLVPIYHPSPQVLASHRPERQQLADYQVIARALRSVEMGYGVNAA
ncbi:MAG TPA: uracil-DNA glycosylase [Pyrinomonadaceae bacterium]|nr:uracil-DNA glycosylase [Pyrinomonadaceae bacterium]